MLGISGQSKSISQRNGDIKKGNQKLPAITPTKPVKIVSKGKKISNHQAKLAIVSPKRPSSVVKPVDQIQQNQTVMEIAMLRLNLPCGSVGESGSVKVRFNHYNKSFPIHNGVLKWADIDEEYCLSFVYKGNFLRNLVLTSLASGDIEGGVQEDDHDVVDGRRLARHDQNHTYYINIADKTEYRLDVVEDPAAGIGGEGLRLNAGPLKATELGSIQPVKSTSRAMDAITAELKSIAVSELNDAHAKDLIERRDLEDILFTA